MNKVEFVVFLVAKGLATTKKEAKKIIDSFVSGVSEATAEGKEISLVGFGSFKQSFKAAKTAKVPGSKDNKTYTTADKMVVRFKVGKALKELAEKAPIVKPAAKAPAKKVAAKKTPAKKVAK